MAINAKETGTDTGIETTKVPGHAVLTALTNIARGTQRSIPLYTRLSDARTIFRRTFIVRGRIQWHKAGAEAAVLYVL